MSRARGWFIPICIAVLLLTSCVKNPFAASTPEKPLSLAPIKVNSTALHGSQSCSDHFIPHTLDHTTTTDDGLIQMFEANGAGVAAGDLDNDGDLDLVLGNLDFPNTILWNEGNLNFRKETFGDARGNSRAITLVDVDGDSRLDIVLTRGTGEINYWHNTQVDAGPGSASNFVRETLPGVNRLAYVLNWGDMDGDGDLDLVTATYDAGLLTDRGNDYLLGNKGGVVYYQADSLVNRAPCSCTWDPRLPEAIRNRPQPTEPPLYQQNVLAPQSMALALILTDFNRDQHPDILIGNDFEVQDQSFFNTEDGWQPVQPFATTSYSTMSLDNGDINNDGTDEIIASDMNPYDTSPHNLADWLPVIANLEPDRSRGDPQIGQNTLQEQNSNGNWSNQATAHGVDATGWSWTARFGDLDNDGWLDLYVVNGMIEERVWSHLPKHELVEENQAFRNDGQGNFVRMPQWGLNAIASGRSMLMEDLDLDGDLDIVVNNLRAPAQLFENQLCGGSALEVDLEQTSVPNRHGVGAQLKLSTTMGILQREVRTFSGYLSGDSSRVTFGLPRDATIDKLEIRWPDGAVSQIEQPSKGVLLHITR